MSNASSERTPPGGDRIVEVLILWGEHSVLHAAHLRRGERFVLGDPEATSERVDFTLAESQLGGPTLTLLEADADATRVHLPADARCTRLKGVEHSSLDGPASVRLEPREQLAFAWQGLHVQVRELEPADTTALSRAAAVPWQEHRWSLVSLGFHCLFLALFQFLPSAAASLNLDESALESRLVSTLIEARSTEPLETPSLLDDRGERTPGGERARDDEGAAGSPRERPTRRRSTGAVEPQGGTPDHEALKEAARTMGISQVLLAMQGPSADVFSDRPQGVVEGEALLGAIAGDLLGANHGYNGLAVKGPGRGGGGDATGTVGVDALHTRGGVGPGGGDVGPGGGDVGDLHGPGGQHGPVIRRRPPEVMGGLAREVIRREIGRHLNEVRFCYEQALRSRPELEGRVTVKFAIGPAGEVLSSAVPQNELGTPEVALCLGSAVRRWRFPAPEGTGVVLVSYPFVFERP